VMTVLHVGVQLACRGSWKQGAAPIGRKPAEGWRPPRRPKVGGGRSSCAKAGQGPKGWAKSPKGRTRSSATDNNQAGVADGPRAGHEVRPPRSGARWRLLEAPSPIAPGKAAVHKGPGVLCSVAGRGRNRQAGSAPRRRRRCAGACSGPGPRRVAKSRGIMPMKPENREAEHGCRRVGHPAKHVPTQRGRDEAESWGQMLLEFGPAAGTASTPSTGVQYGSRGRGPRHKINRDRRSSSPWPGRPAPGFTAACATFCLRQRHQDGPRRSAFPGRGPIYRIQNTK